MGWTFGPAHMAGLGPTHLHIKKEYVSPTIILSWA